MYCVIAGDMITSRTKDAPMRSAILAAAQAAFARINTEHRGVILARFGMVRGDAFEGALRTLTPAPEIVQKIIKAFSEVDDTRVRIAVVYGELTVLSADRNEADGPAFQEAFDLIEQMKKNKSAHWLQVTMRVGGRAQPLLDSTLSLLSALTEGWTEKQRQIAWEMDALSGRQKLVAQKLDIVQSTVSKQLKAAHYAAYCEAWSRISEYFERYEAWEEQKHDERNRRE